MFSEITPQQAFEKLKEGNQRFIEGRMINRDLLAQTQANAFDQHPFAVVFSCMDSRSPPEFAFDQGVGDIFGIRIAGNILNEDILGAMEFATQLIGAKLIAIIAHTNCGAIRGACQKTKLGFLTDLLQKIQPAVAQTMQANVDLDIASEIFVNRVAEANVLLVMQDIQKRSAIIKSLVKNGDLGIVAGVQDLATGKINFFEDAAIMPK